MTGVADRNIQTVAWLVVLLGTVTFVALAVGVPWLARRYLRTATVEEVATAECKIGSCSMAIGGTRLVVRPEDGPQDLREGQEFATDSNSEALIRFVDDSVVNLDHNSAIVVQQLRRPRFESSEQRRRIDFLARPTLPGANASLALGTSWSDGDYVVSTALGTLSVLPETRAHVDVDASRLSVRVHEGSVLVAGNGDGAEFGDAVAVARDERTEVRAGSPPDTAQEALVNIVEDGSFELPPSGDHWRYRIDWPGDPPDDEQPQWGRHQVLDGGRSVIRIERLDSESRSADVVYERQLDDYDVRGASRVELRAQLRVVTQSLPLGGERGSELPLILKLTYESEDGEQFGWAAGFHATEPGPDVPPGKYVLSDDKYVNTQVPLGSWYAFTSGNLLDSQTDGSFEDFGWPRPARLKRLEIIASGHDYAADVDDIAVWVK
jgi:hypothetical protein